MLFCTWYCTSSSFKPHWGLTCYPADKSFHKAMHSHKAATQKIVPRREYNTLNPLSDQGPDENVLLRCRPRSIDRRGCGCTPEGMKSVTRLHVRSHHTKVFDMQQIDPLHSAPRGFGSHNMRRVLRCNLRLRHHAVEPPCCCVGCSHVPRA